MRLRFTIRDLLWLAALVAVCVAWWVDHREMASHLPFTQIMLDKLNLQEMDINNANKQIEKLRLENSRYLSRYGELPKPMSIPLSPASTQ